MNTGKNNRNWGKALGLALTLSSVLFGTSCLDNFEGQPIPPSAFLSIYHASPDAPALDIYTEASRINNNPLEYSATFPYSPFYVGDRKLRFNPYNAANTLLETEFTLEQDKVYSMFLVNKAAELDAIKVEDIWEEPDSEQAQIRLAHLSPDTDDIEVIINENNFLFGEKNEYLEITDFEALDKGEIQVTLKSKESGETLLTVNDIEISGNKVYTLVVRGFSDPANGNNNLSLQLITNYIKF
ncbi:protein of unknown function [Aquiflexum balticum DSM 16537]|uniref:DUF4397 domain-containing protein n=1 Tax=Aquiflexum balticum DSM 16537 TaxID=758820 RepID=A0A1W2H2P3_9BACT|nr:DUF4397 domain-containing protein [Aquiflexum balticum]SMD43215.1 protein of unknown function [Aquiflexum balticum DSM 16537]